MSLVARHLEENGISTVTFSNARDITASACNPRTVFSNFPLGNGCGRPNDRKNQRDVLRAAFELLEHATEGGTIVDTPFRWSESTDWQRLIFSQEQPFLSEKSEQRRREIIQENRASKPSVERA